MRRAFFFIGHKEWIMIGEALEPVRIRVGVGGFPIPRFPESEAVFPWAGPGSSFRQ